MNTYRRIKDKSMTSEISIKKRMRNIVYNIFSIYNINRKNRIYSNNTGRRINFNGL